jgi:hypothetical protein
MQRCKIQQLAVISFNLICLLALCSGCGELREGKKRESLLQQMLEAKASEEEVVQRINLPWVVYDKASDKGKQFGESLSKMGSEDLQKAKDGWRDCDRALWHTTESLVTIIFIRTNTIIAYYMGSQ